MADATAAPAPPLPRDRGTITRNYLDVKRVSGGAAEDGCEARDAFGAD